MVAKPAATITAQSTSSLPATYECISAFAQTDFTEDLKKFDVPTLIMHGDDDQIVPIGITALVSSKIVKGATLKVYPGLPHGTISISKVDTARRERKESDSSGDLVCYNRVQRKRKYAVDR